MTKKILALALAGTTAFSVFASAMSVNAAFSWTDKLTTTKLTFTATPDVITSVAVTADSKAVATTGKATSGTSAISNVGAPSAYSGSASAANFATDLATYAPIYAVAKNLSFDGVGDEISDTALYVYDYPIKAPAKVGDFEKAVTAFIEAYEDADSVLTDATHWATGETETTGLNKTTLLADVETAENALFTAMDNAMAANNTGASSAPEYAQGEPLANTTRADILAAFKTFRDGILPVEDYTFDTATLRSEYSDLYDEVKASKYANEAYKDEAIQGSMLVYLMNRHEELVGDAAIADAYKWEDLVAFYTEILDARNADDYKNTYNYGGFSEKYGKLQDDHKDDDSASELKAYADALYDLILDGSAGTAASSDKTDLKAVITDAKAIADDSDSYNPDSDEWKTFIRIYGEAQTIRDLRSARSYPSTIAAYTEKLTEAIDALDPSSVGEWAWVRLQAAISDAEERVESDYTSSSWKTFNTALTRAQKLLDSTTASTTVISNASQALETATKSLKALKPSAALRKDLKDTIAEAKAAMNEAIGGSAQVLALNNVINDADSLWDTKYSVLKTTTRISDVENAIADLQAAMSAADHPIDWYTDAEGNDRYGTADGDYTDGWHKIDGLWFYFDENGVALKNDWVVSDGKWSWVGSNCVCYRASWILFEGNYYYVDQNGYMLDSEWLGWNGNWYWLDKGGRMATGWRTIGDKQYYFGSDGAMLVNTTTPDGYKVGIDGAYIEA